MHQRLPGLVKEFVLNRAVFNHRTVVSEKALTERTHAIGTTATEQFQ